ncbi:hypothetical protein FOZ63_028840, partial [Perkinsus olseni]
MRFLLLHLLASLCGAGESSDFNSASAGLKAMAAWADSDEELTVGEVAITLYTMRHISRSLLSKGEEATPLFWAWLRDFEDQAESIINAKDELRESCQALDTFQVTWTSQRRPATVEDDFICDVTDGQR